MHQKESPEKGSLHRCIATASVSHRTGDSRCELSQETVPSAGAKCQSHWAALGCAELGVRPRSLPGRFVPGI